MTLPEGEAPRTLVTIATYNEIESLPALLNEVFRHAPSVDLLVIDDNSPDGTGQWCEDLSRREPRLRCLRRSGKLGLGTAILAGMRQAIEGGYEWMLNMDADFSHHPRYLPAMLAVMARPESSPDAADVVIGSRYIPGGGVENWPLRRKLMSWGVNAYARGLLRLPVKDCSGGYRAYRVSLLKQLDLDAVISRGYSFQEEILWRLNRLGARMVEVPITFADRELGQSKINWREGVSALGIILALGLRPNGKTDDAKQPTVG